MIGRLMSVGPDIESNKYARLVGSTMAAAWSLLFSRFETRDGQRAGHDNANRKQEEPGTADR